MPNWGWAIVLLTIIIKALFYPLSAASYRSMAKMKAVAPRMTALRERYGLRLDEVWHDGLTLGGLFQRVQQARGKSAM